LKTKTPEQLTPEEKEKLRKLQLHEMTDRVQILAYESDPLQPGEQTLLKVGFHKT
jgi:hypothetical protein